MWHRAKDRLPANTNVVLISDGHQYFIGGASTSGYWIIDDSELIFLNFDEAPYWTELPELPQEPELSWRSPLIEPPPADQSVFVFIEGGDTYIARVVYREGKYQTYDGTPIRYWRPISNIG